MIYDINYCASVDDAMKSNKHMTVEQLANLEIACFMHKYETENLPFAFCNVFDQNCTNIAKYFPSYSRINITKQSIKYKGPLISNRVPSDIKELKYYKKFRNNLKSSLLK